MNTIIRYLIMETLRTLNEQKIVIEYLIRIFIVRIYRQSLSLFVRKEQNFIKKINYKQIKK